MSALQPVPSSQPPRYLYLPPSEWSPRYAESFYTVARVDEFQWFEHRPPSTKDGEKQQSSAMNMAGNRHQPAIYYAVRIRCGGSRDATTLWRRYSQFVALSRILVKSQSEVKETKLCALPPTSKYSCLLWPWISPKDIAAERVSLLTTWLEDVLRQPGMASHKAVIAFFELSTEESA